MAADDVVATLQGGRRLLGICQDEVHAHANLDRLVGQCSAGTLEHLPGRVDQGDRVAGPREPQRLMSGATTDVDDHQSGTRQVSVQLLGHQLVAHRPTERVVVGHEKLGEVPVRIRAHECAPSSGGVAAGRR